MIQYRCTQCEEGLEAPGELAGKKECCPYCRNVNVVPPPEQPIETLVQAQAVSHASRPVASALPQRRRSGTPFCIVALCATGTALVLFFAPWLDFFLVRYAPYDMLTFVGKGVPEIGRPKIDATPEPEPRRIALYRSEVNLHGGFDRVPYDQFGKRVRGPLPPPAPAPMVRPKSGPILGAFLLGASPIVYGIGVILCLIGGYIMLNHWKSRVLSAGMFVAAMGAASAMAGWALVSSELKDLNAGPLGDALLSKIGITPWCVLALVVTIIGLFASTTAGVRTK